MLKMNSSNTIFSTTDGTLNPNKATLNPNDATLNPNDAIFRNCFITIYFSDQASPYHSVIYFNNAINLLAGLSHYKFVIFIVNIAIYRKTGD